MRELSAYTSVDPTKRIKKYNDHMNNLLSNEKVNVLLIILKLSSIFFSNTIFDILV